ncbi:hypothetical protein LIA77_08748 [Sarocladium implicatum]|nr:hypothetical protein LIA77_08748 [Sarocladium implicatum]
MPSQRSSRRASSSSSSKRRSVVGQDGLSSSHSSSNLSSASVKRDPRGSANSLNSMSPNYSGQSGHAQLPQQQHYSGDVGQPVEPDLHTPQHSNSYNAFGTPVDLSGATLLSQSEYQGITGNLPSSGSVMNSFRQSNGESSNNTSLQMDTPSHHAFTSLEPQTPAPRAAATPEVPSQPPPPRSFPGFLPHQPAVEVIKSFPTRNFRLDGSVCKKLAIEPAVRQPEQRVAHRVLNMGRRGNAEALLCQTTGREATNSCKNCKRGHGPWIKCVVYPGLFYGSCSNCWFNASGARCTFQESNHHPLHHLYTSMAPSYNNPFATSNGNTGQTYGQIYSQAYNIGGPVTHNTPVSASAQGNSIPPISDGPLPHSASSSLPASVPGANSNGVAPVTPVAPVVPVAPAAPAVPVTSVTSIGGSSHPADRDIGVRARHLVRIQAAASELGMRLGEYDEFLRQSGMSALATNMGSSNGQNHNDAEGDDLLHHRDSQSQHSGLDKHDADMTESEHEEGSEDGGHGLHALQRPTLV